MEKIIIDGREFCDKFDYCTLGCPIWDGKRDWDVNGCCPISSSDNYNVEISFVKKKKTNEENKTENEQYPQDQENDEFRFFDWDWLIRLAEGLTRGALKHPGATWKQIPAEEHACRAVRHLVKWLKGDRSEPHLINAGMRVMMAFVTSRERGEE